PIKPTISHSSTDRFASRTAKKLPNALETASASSSMLTPPNSRHDIHPQLEHPSRLVSRDKHDDATVKNECEAGTTAAEPGVGRRLQRNQNKRTYQRAAQSSGAAHRGNDDQLYQHGHAQAP